MLLQFQRHAFTSLSGYQPSALCYPTGCHCLQRSKLLQYSLHGLAKLPSSDSVQVVKHHTRTALGPLAQAVLITHCPTLLLCVHSQEDRFQSSVENNLSWLRDCLQRSSPLMFQLTFQHWNLFTFASADMQTQPKCCCSLRNHHFPFFINQKLILFEQTHVLGREAVFRHSLGNTPSTVPQEMSSSV